ncbi:hypothetical protein [Deinococcus wulumuqiensis]|nr:hypothetical protein [Deinococcus wulumuqiensis]
MKRHGTPAGPQRELPPGFRRSPGVPPPLAAGRWRGRLVYNARHEQ